MSPVSSVYDHLNFDLRSSTNNSNRLPQLPTSQSNYELTERKCLPLSKRRYTVTNISMPESIRYYPKEEAQMKKPVTTHNISSYKQQQQQQPKIISNYSRLPTSSSTIDFRPLITNGRKKLGPVPTSSSMIIIKKKLPSFNSSIQKPLIRSIPFDIMSNNMSVTVSPILPLSLSYSSSSSSTSTSSTNVGGTVFLPIEITKSQQNNTYHTNQIRYQSNSLFNPNHQGYRYVQKPTNPQKSFTYLNSIDEFYLNDDLDESTESPFSSSIGEEGFTYRSTIVMDSNVLRLIRRYDPGNSNTAGNIPRNTLESTRGIWNTISSKLTNNEPSDYSPFFSRRSLTASYEDDVLPKQSTTPRLQRQKAVQENEPPIVPPPPLPPPVNYIRPILKYNSRSRSEFIVQPHQMEPLTVDIDPYVASATNESSTNYQPLITTATKRVCSALSKSEWDLRLQQEQIPVRPPSPPLTLINQQQNKDFSCSTFPRSKSSGILDEQINEDCDEISAPILPTGSCVEKLKQLFVTKSSQDGNESNDSNRTQKLIDKSPSMPKTVPQSRPVNKPTTIIQDVTPIFKKSILRSEKTIDSPESVNRSIHNNNNIKMPSVDMTSDAYRFRRLNDQETVPTRPKNIAKVEPYLMNTNTVHPLHQSSLITQGASETTVVPSSKARINLNSMGNTPTNSSTSSSAASLGNDRVRNSDFLLPNHVHSNSNPIAPTVFSSESLSHAPIHALPSTNLSSINGHPTNFTSSKTHFQDQYQSNNFHSSMKKPSTAISNNSYQYPQQSAIPTYSTIIEQQDNQQPQSRRRFQRRKQMKRSKSVDLHQNPSSFISSTPMNNQDCSRTSQPQRSISREYLNNGENLSSSSSSSSLTADIEHVNRAVLLRYKSLDSIAYNNRKPAINSRNISSNNNNNRRMHSKPSELDFDSDDSVCGIPKPRKLCTSSRNVGKPEKVLVDSSTIERDNREIVRPISIQTAITSTGITNSVRKNETKTSTTATAIMESTPSTAKNEGDENISFAESQFYARTSNTPVTIRRPNDFNDQKQEPIEIPTSVSSRPLSNSTIVNPFERLRPMEISKPSIEDISPPFPDLSIKSISIIDPFDDNNDSSASTTTTTTNRSIHLPVEKQRGLSEIIRKRNSKCKVEDYKRSIQKSNTVDEEAIAAANSPDLTPKYFEVPIDQQNTNDQRTQMSIERLNLLLSKDEEIPQLDENSSVTNKRNLFETITKDTPTNGTAAVACSKSFKTEESAPRIKNYANENQRSKTENILQAEEKETYNDEVSKLSFKEKMTLFNKNKSIGLTPTSSLKNRNRLTQPITAEEVQAAVNLTPSSSTKQLADEINEPEHILPVSKRLEQFKTMSKPEEKPAVSEQKSRPIMKYSAKKTNIDQEQRAKTVDIVRLKADSTVKPKEIHKTTESIITKANNKNVLSVVKSDTISVLKPDDHLDDFFADVNKSPTNETNIQLNTDDLNRIAANTTRLQTQAPRARPPRRQQQGAKNPLRQIQANITTENEYTEVHTNLSEQEIRRLKRAQIAENAGVAQEALAALTSNENFAEINLRKIDQLPLIKSAFEPYKDLMLVLVKGRRSCSLRLVNPTYESINEGDCYLLLTPLKVFAWFGRHANACERARTYDLIDYLKQHRDFGLRNEVKYFLLDQGKDDTENDLHAEFRDILSGEIDDYRLIDDVIDDDFYEINIMDLNRVYRVENDLLIPLNEYCFRALSIKILDPNEVFVFDFGSELYVWNGKFAEKNKRNMGLQLGQQLWNEIYDTSECIIHPFDPLNDQIKFEKTPRPDWCLFGKQNQNVETLLFKGKFIDWPSDFEEIKSNLDTTNTINRLPPTQRPLSIVETLKPADVYQMLDNPLPPVNFIVDQINLGRGRSWFDPRENRGHHIQTITLNIWHIDDNNRYELSKSSYGQFYSDDVYIIRWKYKLLSIGNEQKIDVNRERVIYWIWQGINANLNEKGISGLMSVFLSEEKGVQIHVNQEHEEAAFLQLFDGTMMINLGQHHQSNERSTPWRLYIFLGEIDCETHWWEVRVHCSNLRSRTSFLLLNPTENLILLWHGCQTTEYQQNLAKQSAMKLREKCSEEFHFDGTNDDIEFFEMQEGDEIELFWDALDEKEHLRKYYSLLNQHFQSLPIIRIYHLSSLHGPFIAQEFIYRLHSSDRQAVFPFQQIDLYELHQPALCLIDVEKEIFIWQGWDDHIDDEAKAGIRGPKDIRFTTERRCAFQTAIDYYKTKTGSSTVDIPCSVVYAGLEPLEFISLFPKWNVHIKARQQNQLEGKKPNQKDSVIDLLNHLCRSQYSIDELRARPLPEGVDPSKIESYLSDQDFQNEFHMSKDEFYALPYWKQTNIKKPLGFF